MTVDKIKLRALAKDRDERFFDEGDYLDALNVVAGGTGNSTDGVIKNVKGTVAASSNTTADGVPLSDDARVIGSVSDSKRGYVYYFVWSDTDANHAIYRHKILDNTYQLVLQSSVLAFQQYSFVNAEVINGEFETDSETQTILYFTDNINPPRKINVDRALANNNFVFYSDDELIEALSVAKTPNLFPPEIQMGTDANKTTNDLYGKTFQFATQYVYVDGEHSALSPHSDIVYTKYMAFQGVIDSNITQAFVQEENLALINTRWTDLNAFFSSPQREISKLRLLGRTNNVSPWFLIDEFDPNVDLVKANMTDATNFTYYTAADGVYRFYNDGLYPGVSGAVTDRVYNDVPQKATSQTIVGNRLMYASPNSGYGNVDASAALSVTYHPAPDTGTYLSSSIFNVMSVVHDPASSGDGYLVFLFESAPATIQPNTQLTLTFTYKPPNFTQGGTYDSDGNPGTADVDAPIFRLETTNGIYYGGFGTEPIDVNAGTHYEDVNWATLSATIFVTEETTKAQYLALLNAEIQQQVLNYEFTSDGAAIMSFDVNTENDKTGTDYSLNTFRLSWDMAFVNNSVVDTTDYGGGGTNDAIMLKPKASNFSVPLAPLSTHTGNVSGLNSFEVDTVFTSLRTSQITGDFGTVISAADFYVGYPSVYNPRFVNTFNLDVGVDFVAGAYTLSPTQLNGAKDDNLVLLPLSARRTFKAGCTHDLGIVYFDRHGRPGYVNELGTVYVAPFGDVDARSDGATSPTYYNGPCDINVTMTSDPPDWAVAYQIVYAGMGSFERFESYTVGGAWTEEGDNLTSDPFYVSLNTLVGYQNSGALKDYSYTPGDRLRIVSYVDATDGNTVLYLDDEVVFDIVGLEVKADGIDVNATGGYPDANDPGTSNHVGTFLKLRRIDTANYDDFDGSLDNLWKNQVVVELLTPRKTIGEKIYYEIGEAKRILVSSELDPSETDLHNNGNAIVLTEGDVHYRPMGMLSPDYDANHFNGDSLDNWTFVAKNAESMDACDFVSSRAWSKGRAHVKFEDAQNITYYNRVSYSEENGDDIGDFKLSSFNPDALSWNNFQKRNGAVNFVGELNQNLAVLQENKLTIVPINRNVIEYADGDSNLTVTNNVFGSPQESNGDFGCGNDQSSVLLKDGFIFFADRSRQKILMSNGSEMIPISDIEMSSYFEDEFDALANANGANGRIISGFDPEENMYLVTIEPRSHSVDAYPFENGEAYTGTTVGYSMGDKRWISRYSFLPSNYANIDNKLISCSYDSARDALFWVHNGTGENQYNTFYNTAYDSIITVVSKLSPSNVKVFNAVSYEGENVSNAAGTGLWAIGVNDITTNLGLTSGSVSFTEKEGSLYSKMPRSTVGGAGDSQYINLGDLTFVAGSTSPIYTAPLNLSALPLPLNKSISLLVMTTPLPTTYTGVVIDSIVGNTITFDFSAAAPAMTDNELDGYQVHVGLDASENGDSIRGNWCEMKFTMGSSSAAEEERELYCINTHLVGSRLHHPKGQQ